MKKYQIIYADPPWKYSFPGTRKNKADDYKTMNNAEIKNFDLGSIADEDSILFIWGIWTALSDTLEVIKSWGFEYKTVGFVWVKTNKNLDVNQYKFLPDDRFDDFFGMGYYTRSNSEYCLIATKGNIKPIRNDIRQIVYHPIRSHSQKPNEVRERIVKLMGNLPRIELFAREKHPGWDAWGNEVDSDIELVLR